MNFKDTRGVPLAFVRFESVDAASDALRVLRKLPAIPEDAPPGRLIVEFARRSLR